MTSSIKDMTPLFACRSSAVPVLMDAGKESRSFDIGDFPIYATFVPIGDDAVYPKNAWAFDQMMDLTSNGMIHFTNYHFISTLIAQKKVGTPLLVPARLDDSDLKMKDYQAIIANKTSYEDNNVNFGSPYFRHTVAMRVSDILNRRIVSPAMQPKKNEHELYHDPVLMKYYGDTSMLALNYKLGYYGEETRSKFDIVFLPMYHKPWEQNYEDREIFGFISLFICYDPLWTMREAFDYFRNAYHEYQRSGRNLDKSYVDFSNDPRILDFLKWGTAEEFYNSHFKNYIAINPKLHKSTIMSGINLNPDNENTFETFLKYENAFAHAAKYAAKTAEDHARWMEFYGSVCRKNMLTLQPTHDAYIFDYSKFLWNSNNDFHVTAPNPREGRGIFYEYFPWVTKAYIHESNTLRGFERIQESLFIEATADESDNDAMDIDRDYNSSSSSLAKNQMDSIYTNVFNTLQGINTNAENTFVPSENNVNVEMGERVRHAITECLNDINAYLNQNQTIFETLLTPQHADGLKSLSAQEVELVNEKLVAVAALHERLTNVQERILKVAKNRIFSLATVKATTPTFLALIQYLNGKVLNTELPQANQNALDITDTKPIQQRNIWQYQLHKLDSTLDIVAHSSMYFVTTVRYFMYNARCIHDIYKLVVGMTDAFRTEFNLHFNYGLFGHLGSSKSHAVDEFKKLCLPNSITSVTNQSALANSVSRDMSDRILVMDEGAQVLQSNSKGGSAANYSPEASALKAELTQGFTSRQILDIGKNYKERQTRNILSIKIGSVVITANLIITDLAFRSRWHCAMSEMESDIPKKKKQVHNSPTLALGESSNSGENSVSWTAQEQRLHEQNKERTKLAMPDMFLHVPSSRTKQTASFFTESMHMQHAFSFIMWKLIQIGVFQRPSTHVICLVAIICKYLKTTLKISIPVRTVQRIIIFMQNLSILNAIHMLFNTPGLHEDLKKRTFDLDLFLHLRPYLYCTPQMVIMSFSMLSCEYVKASENIILDGIVEALKMDAIPVERLDMLCHYRNIEFATRENPLLARVNDFMSAIPEAVQDDPLWQDFKTNARLPLEKLYFENNQNNKISGLFRRKHPNAAAIMLKRQQAASSGRRHVAVDANAMDNPPPAAEESGDADTKIDLVYLNTGKTRIKIIDHLITLYGKRIIPDQIRASYTELEEMKITVDTVMPVSEKELQALEPGCELETVQRTFNLIECDEAGEVCISIYMFSEVMNRPGNTNVIVQAIKSFFYRGLKPCTFMTGSELVDDTYDLEFGMHKITASDLTGAHIPVYLSITDPSTIQSTFDNKTGKLLEKIKKNMIRMTILGQETVKAFNARFSSLGKQERTKKKKMNPIVIGRGSKSAAANSSSQVLNIRAVAAATAEALQVNDKTNAIIDKDKNEEFVALLEPEEEKSHEKIYIDINEWVFIKHALNNGIPLRIDPDTRTYMYKPYLSSQWTPIPTSSNISMLHQSYIGDEIVNLVDVPAAAAAIPQQPRPKATPTPTSSVPKRSLMDLLSSTISVPMTTAESPAKKSRTTPTYSLPKAIAASRPPAQVRLFGSLVTTAEQSNTDSNQFGQPSSSKSEDDAEALTFSPDDDLFT